MTKLWNALISTSALVLLLIALIEWKDWQILSAKFPELEMNTIAVPCSAEHWYGRRVRVLGEAGKLHAFRACYDWRKDRWTLTPIPGADH